MALQTASWASRIIFSKRARTEEDDDDSRRNVSGRWASGVSFSIETAEQAIERRREKPSVLAAKEAVFGILCEEEEEQEEEEEVRGDRRDKEEEEAERAIVGGILI